MTHIDNISHILQFGITHTNSPNCNPEYKSIGDFSLIENRNTKKVKINNGDFINTTAPTITLGDFIPFYFGVKMPMLYVVKHGGNFVEKPTPSESIIYLVCLLAKFIHSEFIYYFSDEHATDAFATFYDKTKINELPSIIDWKAIKEPKGRRR